MRKERHFWIYLTVTLAILAFLLYLKNLSQNSELNLTSQREETLRTEMETLRNSLAQARKQIDTTPQDRTTPTGQENQVVPANIVEKSETSAPTGTHSSGPEVWDIEDLKQKGLRNPIQDIKADLMKRGDLIPYEGTLGGSMGFYDEEAIHILNSKWVFAAFDDGHIDGRMLVEYQVSDSGQISWRVIEAYLHE